MLEQLFVHLLIWLQLNELAAVDTVAESASSESPIARSDRSAEGVSPEHLLEAFARPPPADDDEFKQRIWQAIGTLLRAQQPAAPATQDSACTGSGV